MKNNIYGYVRVSTRDQNEQRQTVELREQGISPHAIYMDKQSGKDFQRPAYQRLVHGGVLKKGDLLVVKSIDRLGRNYKEILEEWRFITRKLECDVKILDMPLLDTTRDRDLTGTLISDIVLQLLSYVAENERAMIRQRQAEGIAIAKQRGVRFGRPRKQPPPNFPDIWRMWTEKRISTEKACQEVGLSKHTFYRMARKVQESQEKPARVKGQRGTG